VTPVRGEGGSKRPTASPSLKAAQELKKVAAKSTETYTAYGATEILYKECARQATYTIDRSKYKDFDPPTTEEGEDLGVGGGWWHTGS
jgi:cytochrome b pre-mRNA-processing protein 3